MSLSHALTNTNMHVCNRNRGRHLFAFFFSYLLKLYITTYAYTNQLRGCNEQQQQQQQVCARRRDLYRMTRHY